MAADVRSWVRMLDGCRDDPAVASSAGSSDILITRDLLGTLSTAKNREIGFDDFKLQNSPNSPLLSLLNSKNKKEEESSSSTCSSFSDSKLQDLNYPPRNFFLDEKGLELKLQSFSSSTNSTNYQSVCTLDKVKFALERAEKQTSKKRPPWLPVSPSSSYSSPSKMFAAACPGCLLYVMTSSVNPRCPCCNTFVPTAGKKPRIDLNAAF